MAVVVLAGALVLAGIEADRHSLPAPPVVVTPVPPAAPVTVPASSTTCDRMDVTMGPGDAAMGKHGAPLIFTNRGRRPCTIAGYPELTGTVAGTGAVLRAEPSPNGYGGGLTEGASPVVRLDPGQSAAAGYGGWHIDPATGDASCPQLTRLTVTAPASGITVHLPTTETACKLLIQPVLPATTGGAR